MKTKILFLVLFIQIASAFTQNKTLILTKEQNDKWFRDLKYSRLDTQLDLIKSRIQSDTNIFIIKAYPDGLTLDRFSKLDSLRKIRVTGYCKPLYIISFKEDKIKYYSDNPIQTASIQYLGNLLNNRNINRIDVLNCKSATELYGALYGASCNCNVIAMETKSKKLWKLLEKLNYPSDN